MTPLWAIDVVLHGLIILVTGDASTRGALSLLRTTLLLAQLRAVLTPAVIVLFHAMTIKMYSVLGLAASMFPFAFPNLPLTYQIGIGVLSFLFTSLGSPSPYTLEHPLVNRVSSDFTRILLKADIRESFDEGRKVPDVHILRKVVLAVLVILVFARAARGHEGPVYTMLLGAPA